MNWWLKFSLLILVTIGLTFAIVRVDQHLKRSKGPWSPAHATFRSIVYLILHIGNIFK